MPEPTPERFRDEEPEVRSISYNMKRDGFDSLDEKDEERIRAEETKKGVVDGGKALHTTKIKPFHKNKAA